MKTHRLFLPLAVLASTVLPGSSALIHRWSFNEAAGSAADGAALVDSVGGATGFVRGDGANFTGTGLDLPGGDSMNGRAAYGDLPNNLISVHSTVTLEGWVSVDSSGGGGWTRIFDFGSTQGAAGGGEIHAEVAIQRGPARAPRVLHILARGAHAVLIEHHLRRDACADAEQGTSAASGGADGR